MTPIYLDYNATTPIADEVSDSILPYLREHFGNPSSSHSLGLKCRDAIEEARGWVARLVGAKASEIYFTGGGTESNNLAIRGTFLRERFEKGHFVTSIFEHPAVKKPAQFHETTGGSVTWLPTNQHGVVDLDFAEKVIDEKTGLVSVMHANNEIGTVQPIGEISKICCQKGVLLHTDAAQSVGKIPVHVDDLGVNFLTIAGHKLYAPKGIGALYIREGMQLVPVVHGAAHEGGVRPGTENVAFIVGLGVAAKLLVEKQELQHQLQQLRDRLEGRLRKAVSGLTVNGENAPRLPNTASVNFPGINAAQMLTHLPGLCVSTGAACHSDTVALSDTLKAIGLSPKQGAGTVRISCGRYTTTDEIDQAAEMLIQAWENCIE